MASRFSQAKPKESLAISGTHETLSLPNENSNVSASRIISATIAALKEHSLNAYSLKEGKGRSGWIHNG
jgi:hypothetical protein